MTLNSYADIVAEQLHRGLTRAGTCSMLTGLLVCAGGWASLVLNTRPAEELPRIAQYREVL